MKTGIITAASEKYEHSLLSLIGSLNCNWPGHPPVTVYDLGLTEGTRRLLNESGIAVKDIPAFCGHWRLHYTWKIWCMANAEVDVVLWMDAGVCVLEPLDDVLSVIDRHGYFLVPNYQFLDYEVSEAASRACGVPYEFRFGKATVAGTMIGFRKEGPFGALIKQAFEIALVEDNIKAYDPRHKHDQSIISVLTYKLFPNPVLQDGIKYLGWKGPRMAPGQKVWLQRRNILPADVAYFRRYIGAPGPRYQPKDPHTDVSPVVRLNRYVKMKTKTYLKRALKMDKKDGNR